MIVGAGIDLVEVERIREAVARYGDRFLKRVYTSAELGECWRGALRYQRMASRFAAKEAVAKAIGTGIMGRWLEVQTVRGIDGKPSVSLGGSLLEAARKRGIGRVEITISHTREFGLAQALAYSEQSPMPAPPTGPAPQEDENVGVARPVNPGAASKPGYPSVPRAAVDCRGAGRAPVEDGAGLGQFQSRTGGDE